MDVEAIERAQSLAGEITTESKAARTGDPPLDLELRLEGRLGHQLQRWVPPLRPHIAGHRVLNGLLTEIDARARKSGAEA